MNDVKFYIVATYRDMKTLGSAVPGDICRLDDGSERMFHYHQGRWTEIIGTKATTRNRKTDIGELIIILTNLRSILNVESILSPDENRLVVNCSACFSKRLAGIFPNLQILIGVSLKEDCYSVVWRFDRHLIYINRLEMIELKSASEVANHIICVDRYLSEDFHPQDISYLERINSGGKNDDQ